MREITVTNICQDYEGNLTVLDNQGRVWVGYQQKCAYEGQERCVWVWNRVTLPEVNP